MSSIYDWSLTASDNDDADSTVNWLENQLPNTVNNSARAMMARVAELLKDLGGSVTAGGTGDALTITASSPFATLMDGLIVSFKASASNTGAATANINALGSKAIRKQSASGDVALRVNDIRQNGIYTLIYSTAANSGTGAWMLQGSVPPDVDRFASGTKMLFMQTAAPTGWTKDVAINDKALRVVSGTAGSGGATAFSTVFASRTPAGSVGSTTAGGTVGNTSLTTDQIPSHAHGSGGLTMDSAGAHNHYLSVDFVGSGTSSSGGYIRTYVSGANNALTSTEGTHVHTISGSTSFAGSGASHTHTFTGTSHNHTFTGSAMDFAVAYVDVIAATKD